MARKKIEASIHNFVHRKDGKERDTRSVPSGPEPRQESSRGRQQGRGLMRPIGRVREFFSPSRDSSKDHRIEEGAGENAQVLQEVPQGSALEPGTSREGVGQEGPGKADQPVDMGSVPGTSVNAADAPVNQSPQEDPVGTVPTEHSVDVTSNVDSSAVTLKTMKEDVVVTHPENDKVKKDTDVEDVKEKIESARANVLQMKDISGADKVTGALDLVDSGLDQMDTVSSWLEPLRVFDNVINKISELHPYAKLALSTLSWAAQAILNQTNLDRSVSDLLDKIGHVYSFIVEDDTLVNIDLIRAPLMKLAKLVSECVEFIQGYAKTKSFWERLGKNAFSDSASTIATYNKALDILTQQCRDLILGKVYHTSETLHRDVTHVLGHVNRIQRDIGHTLESIRRIESGIERIEEQGNINKLAYASGAGLDVSKTCLDNTRISLLGDIINWVHNANGENQHVLWLHGQAGKGKSAVAHTIANWFKDLGELGSCFCFAQEQQADRRHHKIFSTIARDLSNHNADYRRALASVAVDDSLVNTPDVKQHWQKFILEPFSQLSTAMSGPIVIVIDALDESGDEASRRSILDALASVEPALLPFNIRILVTSRPLSDIVKMLGHSPYVNAKSMEEISAEIVKHDIQLYISYQLGNLEDALAEKEIARLAEMSDGLFEWARLACEFIRLPNEAATPLERFGDLISSMDEGGGMGLLDKMYETILRDVVGKSDRARSRFRSMMRQILWTKEPLSMDALNAMRCRFPRKEETYDVNLILRSMGALLSGTADGRTPVRPLHASFYDFLAHPPRGGQFSVKIDDMHLDLSFACLRIMQDGLCFNICQLESSYLANLLVEDLEGRIKEAIPSQLSYACQFWASHVQETEFDIGLGKVVEAFFEERVLFWIEALSLLQVLNTGPGSLAGIAQWMEVGLKKLVH
ncbi:hypothetical protein ID866_9017 [Astraeus odoratus]|nr:hypothetical protein ID866_9017 [Astraeus odoratus]